MNNEKTDEEGKQQTENMSPPVESRTVRRIRNKGSDTEINQAGYNEQPTSKPVGSIPHVIVRKCFSRTHSIKPVPRYPSCHERNRNDQNKD
jgi:hypothetical protein